MNISFVNFRIKGDMIEHLAFVRKLFKFSFFFFKDMRNWGCISLVGTLKVCLGTSGLKGIVLVKKKPEFYEHGTFAGYKSEGQGPQMGA